MKYTRLQAFENHLKASMPCNLSGIYLILGKESFERKMAVDALFSIAFKGQNFDCQTYEAERLTAASLASELNSMPLFSAKKIIFIQDGEKLDKLCIAKLEAYFESPSNSIFLVISASAINKNTNFYKKGEKAGVVLEFAEEKPWEKEKSAPEWIVSTLSLTKKSITPSACQLLIKLLGSDLASLYQELQKLVCYAGDRKQITEQDIQAITARVNLANSWQLGESIFRRDSAAALRICKALLLDGTPFLGLLRQIRTQFQTEYQVCSILAAGGFPEDVSRQFPYMKGSILQRHVSLAQSYGMKRLKKGLLNIDHTELQAKNSGLAADLLAELLIIKLTVE